jgi:hypothetical protein
MAALSKKARLEIATLINDIAVATRMRALGGKNRDMWMRVEARAAVTLADKYGIEVPALGLLRDHLEHNCIEIAA